MRYLALILKKYQMDALNPLLPGHNGRHFTDDIFRCTFVNEKFCIMVKSSLKFVPMDPVDIGLGNGLALNRRQAIIQTNADYVYWRIYAALGEMS